MDPLIIGIIGVGALLLLLAFGVPIAFCLATVGMLGTVALIGISPAIWMATTISYHLITTPALMVFPLFIFMGLMASLGGISNDIYHSISLWTGRFRGGLGIATVFSCAAFGVVTGSSLVTAAVFSKISAPEMRRQGYDKRMAYGICSSAGAIGMLIPPSVLIVIYAVLAEESVGQLLIAGIAPGILLIVGFSILIVFISIIKPASVGGGPNSTPMPKVTWREKISSLRLMWPVYIVGTILVGGIAGGIFSPNEASAVGSLVLLIILLSFSGPKRWKVLGNSIMDSVSISGMIFLIIASAGIMGRFLMLSGISPMVLGFITEGGLSPLAFIAIMALVYVAMGTFLDSISMLGMTLPIIIPVVHAMGINPIYFGIVTIVAIESGVLTPPVGMNVYASFGVAQSDVSLEDIFRGSAPFFVIMMVTLGILILFPWVSTVLPELFFN